MQHGPYGITSTLNLFLAVYKAILALHVQIGLLGNTEQSTATDSLMPLLEGMFIRLLKNSTNLFFFWKLELSRHLSSIQENWVHPLIWQLLHGKEGLLPELLYVLKYRGGRTSFTNMFLLGPDTKHYKKQ